MRSRYILGAYWPSREESIEECGSRLGEFFEKLANCDPVLGSWYERGRSRSEASKRHVDGSDPHYLLDLLARGQNRRDAEPREVIEELGFSVGLWNGAEDDKDAGLSIKCGLHWKSQSRNAGLSNNVILTLPSDLGELRRAESMARVLAVVSEAWEPAWAGVMSRSAMNARNFDSGRLFVDWMIYVPWEVDPLPPPTSIVQLAGRGSIVVVQPIAPAGNDPEELARIQRVDELLRKVPV